MIGFLLTFSLYVTTVFLAIIPAFGISYTGAEESPIYILTVLGTNVFAIGYVLFEELFHSKNAKGSRWPYMIPLLITFAYLFEVAFGEIGDSENALKLLQLFYAIAVSGIVVGVYCYRFDKFYLITKNLEPLALLCTAGLIVALPTMYAEEEYASTIGGSGGHQTISYVSAICFSIFLIGLKIKNKDGVGRYKFFASRFFRPVAVSLMVANAVICIIGGGRGGAVLLVINTILSLYYFSRKNLWKTLALIGIGVAVFYCISTNISMWGIDTMFQKGFERAFSFIGSDGIDMSQTSDRDRVYAVACQLIETEPFGGYGLFHQYDLCELYMDQPYSHNLFLELILQGGYLYLIFWIVLYLGMAKKIHHLILKGRDYPFFITIAVYPFVMLMFSGTYLTAPLYWFTLVYVYGMSNGKHEAIRKK